tara:strand:- start:2070 stop:2519 length:450 start_codon:yes stop_codon:yes gene_type:complete
VVNLDLIEFKKDHAHLMVNALMNDPMVQLDEKYHEQLNELEVPGMSFTAIKDNKIICSGGVIPVWDQVFEGWVMGSHLIWKNRISAAKIIKKSMEFLIQQNNIVRLQTAVKKDFYLGHRFAEWLGMEKEGIMKKYQNNEDYYRYARIND